MLFMTQSVTIHNAHSLLHVTSRNFQHKKSSSVCKVYMLGIGTSCKNTSIKYVRNI